jgi:polysaccharide export outer membrane protein
MVKILLYLFMITLMTGCNLKNEYLMFNQTPAMQEGRQNLNQTMTTQIDGMRFEYKIRPHDRITLSTYRHPELSTSEGAIGVAGSLGSSLLVNSQGDIRLPLIGTVKVAGLSQPQAQYKIEKKFREYLRHPSVQLEVINKRAYILGEVHHPGPINLTNEQIPLLQLLSIAGDITTRANYHNIMILKNSEGSIKTKIISLTGKDSIQVANQMIRPNDIVYVLPKEISLFNNKVDELNPVFQLISNALTPFLTIRLLTQ